MSALSANSVEKLSGANPIADNDCNESSNNQSSNLINPIGSSVPLIKPVTAAAVPATLIVYSASLCRICQATIPHEDLISPCHCKGSMAHVHLSCLEKWLNQSSRNYCELCLYQYNSIETPRYRLWESIGLWVRHPRNRSRIRLNLLIMVILTLATIGLLAICLIGMEHFMLEGKRIGVRKNWTRVGMAIFLGLVIMGYMTTVYLLIKDQLVPWYNWWKRTVNIKLLVDSTTVNI